jgi:ATP-binding cassette, subfamily C (CFTR/MRP), member 10
MINAHNIIIFRYLYAGALLAATIISALFIVHFNWLMSIIGLKMRGAIVSTILRKTLSVTSTDLSKSFTVGEITNFMSTDTDRIVNSCPSFHALWSIPLQVSMKVKYIHTYHSRFIPVEVAEASQIFLQDAHDLPKLFSYE